MTPREIVQVMTVEPWVRHRSASRGETPSMTGSIDRILQSIRECRQFKKIRTGGNRENRAGREPGTNTIKHGLDQPQRSQRSPRKRKNPLSVCSVISVAYVSVFNPCSSVANFFDLEWGNIIARYHRDLLLFGGPINDASRFSCHCISMPGN